MKHPSLYKGVARLVLLLAVAPCLIYRFSCSRTVHTWNTYRKITKTLPALRAETARLQNPLPGNTPSTKNDTAASVKTIPTPEFLFPLIQRHGCTVEDYIPFKTGNYETLSLITSQIILCGPFASLVCITDEIERGAPECKILSANFHTAGQPGIPNKKQLKLTLLLQYISDENE